jgi:hypothetical protein
VGGVTNWPASHGSTLVDWHGLFDQRNPQFPFLWEVGASIGKERSVIRVQPRSQTNRLGAKHLKHAIRH